MMLYLGSITRLALPVKVAPIFIFTDVSKMLKASFLSFLSPVFFVSLSAGVLNSG